MVQTKLHPICLVGVIVALVLFRLIPHPPNATPIAAMAIFAGAVFTNRYLAYLVPIVAMLISDAVLGLHTTILYVYVGLVLIVLLGSSLKQISAIRIGFITILASVLFYLLTNFGSWLHHDMYSPDFAGLLQAYIAGLPFLRNALIANLIFTYLIFYSLAWFKGGYFLEKNIQH